MHVKPYQDKIKPGQYLLDLIHSDVSTSDLQSCFRAKYYVIFLDDYDKTSKVILLFSKNRVLAAFDLFWKRNKDGEACIRRLCMDGGGKYDSYTFKDYRNEYGMRQEVIVPKNSQINGVVERLGQMLHDMASAMFKESGFSMKYWSELIFISNYLYN